ncbi:MAG TPA: sigma-54 dependent transcriptional regulator [Candidatus Sulfotelmatobacter sp.]|jgi:DNA-binding NtrC family response regulator|nr:sigma-54 dependent transcriptional regulator [Candidatus Sulfotelmatobacter sp.]
MEIEAKESKADPLSVRTAALSLLVVDDEDSTRNLCRDVGVDAGLEIYGAATTEEALRILDQYPVDIVVTDLQVPQIGGLELLKHVRTTNPEISVIVLTQYGTIETAIEATRLGATDYVTKPFHVEELRGKLDRLTHAIEMDQENRLLREELRSRPGFGGIIGMSPRMQRVYKLIQKVAQHSYPVLILGESGTGKELVAHSIHFSGPRKNRPFAPVDCSSLVPTLIESELFGYVKGAFTGAQHTKQGLFESAGDGTLFLDEIGDLPIDLQAKLLRALQEREIKPVGSNERIGIRARVIAATNRDLESAIRSGSFRQDLYFRLNVVQIKLPPLRERKADIPLLVTTFLEKFSDPARPIHTISEDAMRRIVAYDWPGNIRELENAIERAVALGSGPILHAGDLPSNLQYTPPEKLNDVDELVPLEILERRAIFRALQETSGDKLAAARLLGIGKTTLYRKLKQYESGRPQA